MPTFLISPPTETDWRISPQELERLARQNWSAVEISHRAESPYPTHLVIEGEGPTIIAGLDKDGSTLFVEGDVERAIAVAQWFRQQVPPDQPLIFFDQEYSAQVELGPDTSAEQLAAPFGGA